MAVNSEDIDLADAKAGDLSSSSEEEVFDSELTTNQIRLLYMVSLYTHPADETHPKESWVRQQALMVLIYEAIVAEVLDYDYAPASAIVENRRKYFNISQEGRSDVDYLREQGMINGLKLASKEYQPVTCYQISAKGVDHVNKMTRHDRNEVNAFSYEHGTKNLLKVDWRNDVYYLVSDSGYERESSVTDCEDVSYVSSAYLPACLRHGGRPTLSNAHRAHECAVSTDNIRDELDEVITLNSVSIIVAEYIPFGANQIVQLNQNLGSTERVQGGFFTALIDENSAGTEFEVDPGLTSVNILDYTLTRHVNFEADIRLPEPPGVVQVEMFGVCAQSSGAVFYGMQIEAVMDRVRDNISLDHLSRLLVDVHIDSSAIIDSVISSYQRTLLDLIFLGDAASRDKVNLIVADEINPHLTAEEYMDKDEYENELKQVLGETRAAFDISERDTLVFGEHGLLVGGPSCRLYEGLLCTYIEFIGMDLFVRNFFSRMFVVQDDMKTVSALIENSERDPNSIVNIRRGMARISKDIILMEEVLGYLTESLRTRKVPPEPVEQNGRALYDRLQIGDLATELDRRISDLNKNMEGARHEFDILREMSNVVSETKLFRLYESVETNTARLITLQGVNVRSASALEVMQIVLCGSLAFDLLDRVFGQWTVVNTSWLESFATIMLQDVPFLWFALNLVLWCLMAYAVTKVLRYLRFKSEGVVTVRAKVKRKIKMDEFMDFLRTKRTFSEERQVETASQNVLVKWQEKASLDEWGGGSPIIGLEYDPDNGYLLNLRIEYNRRAAAKGRALDAEQLSTTIFKQLENAMVFDEASSAASGLAMVAM